MPFVQMENISHYLRACQAPPLSLQAHDCFLTVDLYESKDPAQVLQCIEAFSRRANAVNPTRINKAIGGRKAGVMSPQGTGTSSGGGTPTYSRARGISNTSESSNTAGGRASPTKSATTSPSSSSWAKKGDMGATAPAWNISQYGWTGGASQGNQGISFGGRRQITTPSPQIPSLADKERRRREKEEEEERLRLQAEEAERKRRAAREAEDKRAKADEERRWQEESTKRQEEERRAAEEEKRRWEEEERKWREEEDARIREEKEAEKLLEKERQQKRAGNDSRLKGQFLSQYQAEIKVPSADSERIKELERQLEEAKERERMYERSRQARSGTSTPVAAPPPLSIRQPPKEPASEYDGGDDSFQSSEREFLYKAWSDNQSAPPQPPRSVEVAPPQPPRPTETAPPQPPRPTETPPTQPPRPLPVPQAKSPRPLPNPATYASQSSTTSRTDRFLSSNPAPPPAAPASHTASEAAFSSTSERAAEDARRQASQQKTKAAGWASKSLLEREMERERERQREWEEEQKQTKEAASQGQADPNAGSGPGQSWDVNTYGFTGGDSLNKGGQGVYSGRRQLGGPRPLVGPRPLGSKGA